MTWERALEADARLAAKNALLVRAALRQQLDFEAAYRGYLATTPDTSLSLPQQRVRARAWAIINIRPNLEPLKQVIDKLWAEGLALGYTAAGEALIEAEQAKKADTTSVVDWSKWKAGDEAASLVAKKPGLMNLLRQAQGFTWKGFSDTTLNDLGNSIGEAIALGLDAKRSAKNIMNHVASPARALTIAITEQNRAISYATSVRYREAGLQQMEWLVFDPCKICAQNANMVVNIGQPFPSGDQRPPAHPNCRCALAPVIPGFDDQPLPGATVIAPPTPAPVNVSASIPQVVTAPTGEFVPGQWNKLSRIEIENRVIDSYLAANPRYSRSEIIDFIQQRRIKNADLALIQSGRILKNGPIEVQFYSAGAKVTPAAEKKLLEGIDELQKYMPKEKMTIIVASERGTAYGKAIIGDAKIWLKPSLVMDNKPLTAELGFKMPAIGVVAHRDYTLAHEWGHTVDVGGTFTRTESVQNATTKKIIEDLKKEFEGKAFMSTYSGENTKEFYAEMFAEFYLTKGTTDNPLVQAMAKQFNWKAPAAPVVNTPAVAVGNYVTAKKTKDYWTADKLLEMYGRNAKGDLDFGAYNRNGQNLYLKNILQEQGFNGLPKVVNATEFQKYLDQGSIPLFRGIAGKTPEEVNEFVTQYMTGSSPFIGKGMFGDGTYFGAKRSTGENFAKKDREGNDIPHGKVLEATLDPRAKVIDLEDLRKLEDQMFSEGYYNYPQDYYEDPGALAASLGYDAVRIKNPKINWSLQGTAEDDYYIILNRTAVIVKEMP